METNNVTLLKKDCPFVYTYLYYLPHGCMTACIHAIMLSKIIRYNKANSHLKQTFDYLDNPVAVMLTKIRP